MHFYIILLWQSCFCLDVTDKPPDPLFAFTFPQIHILGSQVTYIINPYPWSNVSPDFEYYLDITLSLNLMTISKKAITIRPNSDEAAVFGKQDFPVNLLENVNLEATISPIVTMKARLADGTPIGESTSMEFVLQDMYVPRLILDKKFYIKGDLVQFVYTLTDVVLGKTYIAIKSFRYHVISPSDTIITDKKLIDPSKLLHTDKFQLDEFAEAGAWKVSVTAETAIRNYTRSFTFAVIDYVRPTFEVQINIEENHIWGNISDGIPFQIIAADSFGHPVAGSATISFQSDCTYNEMSEMVPVRRREVSDNCSWAATDVLNFNGTYADTISSVTANSIIKNTCLDWCPFPAIRILANVTNSQTGLTEGDEAVLYYTYQRYTMRDSLSSMNDDIDIEGLPYFIVFKIGTYYNSNIVQKIAGTVVFEFEANGRTSQIYNVTVMPEDDGCVKILLPDEFRNESMVVTKGTFYDNDGYSVSYTKYSYLRTKKDVKYLRLSVGNSPIEMNTDVTVTIVGNYNSSAVNFVATVLYRIVYYRNLKIIANEPVTLRVPISTDYRLVLHFRVFDAEANGEIADSFSVMMPVVFAAPLAVSAPSTAAAIGENIELDFQTSGTSQVLVIAHDNPDSRLSIEFPELDDCYLGIPRDDGRGIRDSSFAIHQQSSETDVNSNASNYTVPYDNRSLKMGFPQQPVYVPKKMPFNLQKTWIFETVDTNANGFGELNGKVMPDSIRPWSVETIVLTENNAGLGNVVTLTVKQTLYIELQCPSILKNGENFLLKSALYNTFDDEVEAIVTLSNGPFEVQIGSKSRNLTVPAGLSETTQWVIKPTQIGLVTFVVSAISNMGTDRSEIELVVIPEGIPLRKSHNRLLEDNEEFKVALTFPPNLVPGSKRLEVLIFGDIMANTLDNIENLLKMPSGCGEQNMYNFAPAVFIFEYLRFTNGLTVEIEEKATRIINTGYQRQLNYRHANGGYSIWGGQNNAQASTVLTSFVQRCFMHADKLFNFELIDAKIQSTANAFLLSTFQNGHFVENGRLFSSRLSGGLDKDGQIAVTTYVAIFFAENIDHFDLSTRMIVEEAMEGMEVALNNPDMSSHTLSMICYVFHLLDHTSKHEALQHITSRATSEMGITKWVSNNRRGNEIANIEIAAYVLMSLLQDATSQNLATALPIFLGMQREMTDLGGFSSTQDTVLGIQAMSMFALEFGNEDNMMMNVDLNMFDDAGIGSTIGERIEIKKANAMIVRHQNVILPDDVNKVAVKTEGTGKVFASVVQHYNIYEEEVDNATAAFNLSFSEITVKRKRREAGDPIPDLCLLITAKSNDPDIGSGMTLVLVDHPSGYGFKSYEEPAGQYVQKRESSNDQTTFYYDELLQERLVIICLEYLSSVSNPKPVFVWVQDYYNPTEKIVGKVVLADRQNENPCDLCGCDCSECYTDACAATHEPVCPIDSPLFSVQCYPDLTVQIDINLGCLGKYHPTLSVTDLRLMPSGPADQCAPCSANCSIDDNYYQNQALTQPVSTNSLVIFFKATKCGAVMEVASGTGITSFTSQIGTRAGMEAGMEAVDFVCKYDEIINNVSSAFGTVVMGHEATIPTTPANPTSPANPTTPVTPIPPASPTTPAYHMTPATSGNFTTTVTAIPPTNTTTPGTPQTSAITAGGVAVSFAACLAIICVL